MLAIVAAVLFLIALIVALFSISLGVITAEVLVIAGLLSLALYHAGVGDRSRIGRR